MRAHLYSRFILFLVLAATLASCNGDIEKKCFYAAEKEFPLDGFKKIFSGKTVQFEIRKGAGWKVRAEGCRDDVEGLDLEVRDSILDVKFKCVKRSHNPLIITITSPVDITVDFFGGLKKKRKKVLRTVRPAVAERKSGPQVSPPQSSVTNSYYCDQL